MLERNGYNLSFTFLSSKLYIFTIFQSNPCLYRPTHKESWSQGFRSPYDQQTKIYLSTLTSATGELFYVISQESIDDKLQG